MKFPFKSQVMKLRGFLYKKISYRNITILTMADGNKLIGQLLKKQTPSAIGKIGATENQVIREFLSQGKINSSSKSCQFLYSYSGVFPKNNKIIETFCVQFIDAIKNLDLLAAWFNYGEANIIKNYAIQAKAIDLKALEPYYHEDPWSRYLENKKILVIHPFAESIEKQYKNRSKIWVNKDCLPVFELNTIKAPLSDSIVKSEFDSWIEALNYMKNEMEQKEFDVLIVGAGAYSIPLVAHAKKMGKVGIHLGGATQILFGIKGGRWDNHEIGQKFYNDYWIRPSKQETPENLTQVRTSEYW